MYETFGGFKIKSMCQFDPLRSDEIRKTKCERNVEPRKKALRRTNTYVQPKRKKRFRKISLRRWELIIQQFEAGMTMRLNVIRMGCQTMHSRNARQVSTLGCGLCLMEGPTLLTQQFVQRLSTT
jgi:hypothetical protein